MRIDNGRNFIQTADQRSADQRSSPGSHASEGLLPSQQKSQGAGGAQSQTPGPHLVTSSTVENEGNQSAKGGKSQGPPSQGKQATDPRALAVIAQLRQTDQKVRMHEAAHISAGGAYVTGGPSYTYQTGPDGKRYAVSGEVQIDTSPVPDDPEATIIKMEAIRKAALAPAQPSSQDLSVAASAARNEQEARREAHSRNNDQLGEKNQAKPTLDVKG